MPPWTCVLELDTNRRLLSGSEGQLVQAIRNGADLRICTEFLHNEHIDVTSENAERIREVAAFGVTCVVEDRWVAGIMSLRQPIELPEGFGPRPSMSFFLYNQNGEQAIARPYLDGTPASGSPGRSPDHSPEGMHKYQVLDSWDGGTNAPSQNFIYDFDVYRYSVSDSWREVLTHEEHGRVASGSLKDLVDAFSSGCAVKIAVRGLCSDIQGEEETTLEHEVFVETGSGYYYTEQKLFMVGTHPVIRVKADIPMRYSTGGWDFGWLMVRTDGRVVYRRCDPYTLKFEDRVYHHPVRWFVR
ncbi:MAG: hypothetical protein O2857_25175 [Planctomycetota bacterium]|nr:hypothetical protein [Planctomycetota bacterium]